MSKRRGYAADDIKSETLPQVNGTLVRSDHKIELHRVEAAPTSVIQRVRAHGTGHAASRRRWGSDVAAVGDVRATAALIRLQKVSAQYGSVFFRNEDLVSRRHPIGQSFFATHVCGQRIRFSGTDRRFENVPDRVCVGR